MPGKVNPVIAESVCQVSAHVMGNDLSVLVAGQAGNFELNVMMPVMAHNLLESIGLLAASARNFSEQCIDGIRADRKRADDMVEKSLAMCTALAPEIGYDQAAAIAKESYRSGRTVREIATEQNVLPPARLRELLDPRAMTEPGIAGRGSRGKKKRRPAAKR
jgi:fumarate hydratase class II